MTAQVPAVRLTGDEVCERWQDLIEETLCDPHRIALAKLIDEALEAAAAPAAPPPAKPYGVAVLCLSRKIHESLAGEAAFWYDDLYDDARALVAELDADPTVCVCGPHQVAALHLAEPGDGASVADHAGAGRDPRGCMRRQLGLP